MKHLTFLFLFYMLTVSSVLAQPLMGRGTESNAFGGPALKVTQLNDESVVFFGGRGGVTLNKTLVIGAGFYRLLGDIEAPEAAQINPNVTTDLDLEYVGLDLEYIVAPQRLLHFSIQTLIGSGRAQYWEGDDRVRVEDGIWIFEPGFNVMLRVTTFFQIGLGASYRFVSGVDRLDGLESQDLNDASANLVFKFGKF